MSIQNYYVLCCKPEIQLLPLFTNMKLNFEKRIRLFLKALPAPAPRVIFLYAAFANNDDEDDDTI